MFKSILSAFGVIAASTPAAQPQITPKPEVLTGAFLPGFVGEADEKRYPIRVIRLGEVRIASGRVILADPFLMSTQNLPLTVEVPPGRYPVDLAVADAGESGQRVALARLLISTEPAVKWSLAVTEEQDPRTLKADDIFGYGVDAGTGAFIDASVPTWLEEQYPPSNFQAYEAVTDDWQTRGEAAAEPLGIPYGFALIETLGPGDAAMFSSGWGDGYYASWIGYDANGAPVAVVTDFAVITAVIFPPASDSR